MKSKAITFVFLVLLSSHLLAEEGCPPGQIPYQADGAITSCGPIPGGYNRPQAPRPTGKWIKTWGAIAGDSKGNGSYGVAVGQLSEKAAEKLAIAECIEAGGSSCTLKISYKNQCVAMAEPISSDGMPIQGYVRAFRSESEELSKVEAIKLCQSSNNSKCRAMYSACTEPIFEAF